MCCKSLHIAHDSMDTSWPVVAKLALTASVRNKTNLTPSTKFASCHFTACSAANNGSTTRCTVQHLPLDRHEDAQTGLQVDKSQKQ